MSRLKNAYEAGYYKTEASVGEQVGFPWQARTSKRLLVRWLFAAARALPPFRRNPGPVRCFRCGRHFSTMTQGVRTMHQVSCWECHRVHVLHEPMMMSTYGRTPPSR